MIYSHTIADRVLSSLIQDASLCLNSKYPIEKEDFECVQFHKILYATIYNLAIKGVKTVTLIDIEEFLKPYDVQYNIYNDSQGADYISTILELGDKDNYEYYYNELRKYSCLREYKKQGFDITEIYDESKDDNSGLDGWKIEDIVGWFEGKQLDIKQNYISADEELEKTKAGEGIGDYINQLMKTPLYGHSYCSNLLNAVTRGMLDGSLNCFSSPTGVGKTTVAIANMCKICSPELWDYDKKEFVQNKSKTCNGSLMIQFELNNIEELTPKFIANISGIASDIILDGTFNEEQKNRIDKAIQILKDSNIHLVYMPNFTKQSIEDCIKEHTIKYKIEFLVYDYIQEGSSLNAEMNSSNGGIGMRSDQVLTNLSDFLKQMASKYKLPCYTMTQTNATLGQSEVLEQGVIAGSRATANKFVTGGVLLPLRLKEEKIMEIIENEIEKRGFGNIKPNYIFHMYKIRFGKYPQNVKVWVNIDLGTGRMQDCYVTNWQNKLIKVQEKKLERID